MRDTGLVDVNGNSIMIIGEYTGDYRWLSNFWPIKHMVYKGLNFYTAEHAYQSAKAKFLTDKIEISLIPANKAGSAKRYFRHIPHHVVDEWNDELRLTVMEEIQIIKFTENRKMKKLLLSTGDAILEEGNRWGDTFFGVCPPYSGNGENHLGKIQMKVRRKLQDKL